jgi:hypothetical protein
LIITVRKSISIVIGAVCAVFDGLNAGLVVDASIVVTVCLAVRVVVGLVLTITVLTALRFGIRVGICIGIGIGIGVRFGVFDGFGIRVISPLACLDSDEAVHWIAVAILVLEVVIWTVAFASMQ